MGRIDDIRARLSDDDRRVVEAITKRIDCDGDIDALIAIHDRHLDSARVRLRQAERTVAMREYVIERLQALRAGDKR